MMVKVVDGGKGRGGCGHIIRKAEPYFIVAENGHLTATCKNCARQKFGAIPKVKGIKAKDLVKWRYV